MRTTKNNGYFGRALELRLLEILVTHYNAKEL